MLYLGDCLKHFANNLQINSFKVFLSFFTIFGCTNVLNEVIYILYIETGRYGVNRVPAEERLCDACNSVEDEFHVLMKCPLYRDARGICLNSISAVSDVFADLPQESQFIELMSNPLYYKIISKFMYTILNQRRYLLYL